MTSELHLFRIRVDEKSSIIGQMPTVIVAECDCYARNTAHAAAIAGYMASDSPIVAVTDVHNLQVYAAAPPDLCAQPGGCKCSS